MNSIINWLSAWIVAAISHLGYGGVVLLMGIESACIPLSSEVILPFSGYLVYTGRFSLFWVSLAGAVGCNLGSMVAYAVGYYGGRPLAHRYGRWLLISRNDLDRAEAWFRRYGDLTVLISRMLPVVRTYIALPAGVARMPLIRFNVFTFIGSWVWCWALAYIGYRLGAHWEEIGPVFHRLDIIWVPLLAALIVAFFWHHIHRWRRSFSENGEKVTKGA
jgi:membrane protein DedA with SNARE-associated domain